MQQNLFHSVDLTENSIPETQLSYCKNALKSLFLKFNIYLSSSHDRMAAWHEFHCNNQTNDKTKKKSMLKVKDNNID